MCGFFAHTVHSKRRHAIAILKKSEMCRCGCRGWCSVWPVFSALRWMYRACSNGRMPDRRHDGRPFAAGDPRGQRAGAPISRSVLVWIKGDLVEQSTTFGLRGHASFWRPCTLCTATSDVMFDYDSCSLFSDIWGEHDATAYEEACRKCEVYVFIKDEETKMLVSGC